MKKVFINKKKTNFFNINFYFLFFILFILISFFFLFNNFNKITNKTFNLIEKYSLNYGYTLKEINISQLNYLNNEEILKYFKSYKNKSIFMIPFHDLANEISRNKWIKEIKINSNYKNSINIFIEEERPFAIYDNFSQKVLFSDNFVALEILNESKEFFNLPIFYGTNSLNNSKELYKNFNSNFKKTIKSANYIENRRWNLKLLNNITLKLPEKDIDKAMQKYEKIYANFSNKDLKDIDIIDLRIKNKAIIKYKNEIND